MSEPERPVARLIWERPERGSRGPLPALTREHLILAATRVADGEGLAAVTMRRVAAELGVGTMSLYRYVSSKEDLLDLAFDAAYGELALPASPSGKWREDLRWMAHTSRSLLRQHPWTATVLAVRPPLGPNYLRYFEFTLAVAAPLTRDLTHAARLVGTLHAFVLGSTTFELAEAEADRRTGLTDAQKRAVAGPYLDGLLASGRFPYLGRFLGEGIDADYDRGFEFGLECVLDGLAASLKLNAPNSSVE